MSILAAYVVPHPPMIIPEVGRGSEDQVRTTIDSYEAIASEIAALKPETIVISSPHSILYADYFHISPGSAAKGDMRQFHAPQVKIRAEYDSDFSEALAKAASAEGFPAGTLGERNAELDHGTLIPLYYVNQFLTDYRLVRIGLSGLPLTDEIIHDPPAWIVVSRDRHLTHIMEQIKIEVIYLTFFQLFLENFRRIVTVGDLVSRIFVSKEEGLPRVTGKGFADHDL